MKLQMTSKAAALAALLSGLCFSPQAGQAQDPSIADHAAAAQAIQQAKAETGSGNNYAGKVRENYNFRFGKDKLFAPGNASTESGDFVQAGSFPSVKYCSHCHQEAYTQWRQALHSNSFRTPFYRATVNILLRTKGIEYSRHCESCHHPIGVLSGALTQHGMVDRQIDLDGITCATCHSIEKVKSTEGNGGYVMGIPAAMVDENGKPIPGEAPYDQIRKYPERHAKAVMKDFYKTTEFCASCHKANLPAPINDYKFLRAFTTYDEWQNSKFSGQNPLTFYTGDPSTCQGCHMKRQPATHQDDGAKNGTFASHRWAGGNTAVPFYYGYTEQLQKTIDFLKAGNYLNVDLFAIKKSNSEDLIAPLGSKPFQLAANDIVQTLVVIQNKNIGHSLIPEQRDIYEAWVEFIAKQSDGTEIYHSGFIQPDGMLDARAHSFTNRPVNANGDYVEKHQVWTIHSMAYDNTIPSGRSALVRYEFRIPPNTKGPVTITARVNYRHLRQGYLNYVFGKDHPAYPIVELSARTRTLAIGDNPAATPDPQDNPDWMRWNNLGITYLDQLQYAEAIQAFSEVVKLRPDYADGYTNIGLTNIMWEKYASARNSLEKSLALSPENTRALYYMSLVEKRQGNVEAEMTDLKKVIAKFPRSRDALRELGSAYYREHRYEEACRQFEAVQAVDPDDVAAHYNLAILYRRLGLPEKAAVESAAFATKKVDPGAPTYSVGYLQAHPETSEESIPWHVHSGLHPAVPGAGAP
jgi:tetratricopeptide (TPR) repeat protein